MKVLVTWASKHGATAGIAGEIANVLREAGNDVVLSPVEEGTVEGFDAVVVGSAVYVGHWMKPARDFVVANSAALVDRPVWLFSSGPIGDPPKPAEEPIDIEEMLSSSGARGHQVFAGKLDKHMLGLGERTVVRLVHGTYGDFRDWGDIRAWAAGIASALVHEATAAPTRG